MDPSAHQEIYLPGKLKDAGFVAAILLDRLHVIYPNRGKDRTPLVEFDVFRVGR